jgi:hypothetical protein
MTGGLEMLSNAVQNQRSGIASAGAWLQRSARATRRCPSADWNSMFTSASGRCSGLSVPSARGMPW